MWCLTLTLTLTLTLIGTQDTHKCGVCDSNFDVDYFQRLQPGNPNFHNPSLTR